MNKFDELTKGLAQFTTRRAALKKFGIGLSAIGLAMLGLAKNAAAGPPQYQCDCSGLVPSWGCSPKDKKCLRHCGCACSGGVPGITC